MKNIKFILAITALSASFIFSSCKKKETAEPSTPTPTPSTTNIELKFSIVEYSDSGYPSTFVAPNYQVVSSSGAIISSQTIAISDTIASSSPSPCSLSLASTTVSQPLLNDGSHYTVKIYDGTTLVKTLLVYYNNVVDGPPGLAAATICTYSPNRVIVGR